MKNPKELAEEYGFPTVQRLGERDGAVYWLPIPSDEDKGASIGLPFLIKEFEGEVSISQSLDNIDIITTFFPDDEDNL